MKKIIKTLHLPIKKEWFDMIASGIKTEEYREISDHWIARLIETKVKVVGEGFKKYDVIKFTNGYAANAPSLTVEHISTHIGLGRIGWGADLGKKYFVIKLGEIC